jgi:spore coat protein CotF
MATKTGFTAHETIGVHEALRCRALGLTKMRMMQPMIQDAELKRFLAQEITASIQEVQQLETWAHQITP